MQARILLLKAPRETEQVVQTQLLFLLQLFRVVVVAVRAREASQEALEEVLEETQVALHQEREHRGKETQEELDLRTATGTPEVAVVKLP